MKIIRIELLVSSFKKLLFLCFLIFLSELDGCLEE